MGYSLWGCKELDMTKQLTHIHTHNHYGLFLDSSLVRVIISNINLNLVSPLGKSC